MSVRNLRYLVMQWQSFADSIAIALHDFMSAGPGPGPALAVAGVPAFRPPVLPPAGQAPTLEDGMLWAVPKSRRSVERRMMRRFGAENWPTGRKLIKPKNNLIVCMTCGGHHLPGMLCMTCYSRVMEETREMQRAIAADLGLQPVEKEVAVVYQGEKETIEDQQAEAVRVVEMPKERPQWFSKNLAQRVITPPAETAAVKPSDLG